MNTAEKITVLLSNPEALAVVDDSQGQVVEIHSTATAVVEAADKIGEARRHSMRVLTAPAALSILL